MPPWMQRTAWYRSRGNDQQCIDLGYNHDKLLALVIEKPLGYPTFMVQDNPIWKKNLWGDEVLCLPRDCKLLLEILIQVHETIRHFGSQRTNKYIQQWYWWQCQAKDTPEFCTTCNACQHSKPSNKLPVGKHHPLLILIKPWNSIGRDFIGPFPKSKGFNYLWVIIYHMMSMVHLIPVHTTMTATQLSWIYKCGVVHLYSLPNTIVSDCDSKFMSRQWWELHYVLGVKLLMLTLFFTHKQMDKQKVPTEMLGKYFDLSSDIIRRTG